MSEILKCGGKSASCKHSIKALKHLLHSPMLVQCPGHSGPAEHLLTE